MYFIINMVKWNYSKFQDWIKNGCDKNISSQVTYLDMCGIGLKEIPKEIKYLTQLKELHCHLNKIKKIDVICGLNKLKILDCSHNNISKIPKEINKLVQLKNFNCSNNNISKIPKEINNLVQLIIFECCNNMIKNIPVEISNCVNLKYFCCYGNKINKIPKEIGNLIQLRKFFCENNKITSIPIEFGNLTQLQEFNCSNNKITSIPIEISNCVNLNLRYFRYNGNEINYFQPQLIRWLNRTFHTQQIYNDTQSVHNHSIQEGVSKSINYITSIKPTIQKEQLKELIISNSHLDERIKCLLFEYMDSKDVHSILNITFEELLLSVYDFIEKNENKEELYRIMNVEMSEANCKCFTGRISRLINVLNGFDKRIEIHIADNEQIGNVISVIRNNIGENYEENEFKRRVKEELLMRQYSEETIKEWIDNI